VQSSGALVARARRAEATPLHTRTSSTRDRAYVEGFKSAHKVIRFRDEAHLQSIIDSEILEAGETLHEELKPRAVIY
jgi:hypothetical protein